ncbi:MAG: type II toxin-antitoxin system HicA family toxin [Candidatus Altimarinota bacterium]
MPKLPIISGKNLLKVLKKAGYIEVRKKGSHVFVEQKSSERSTVIPVHANEDLGKGILKRILNDLEISVDELIEMINS